jgi:hypothetical protein
VALEELLIALNAVRHADHRTGPTLDVIDYPAADRLIRTRVASTDHAQQRIRFLRPNSALKASWA